MSPAVKALPPYLRKYVAEQNYEKYTTEDHAAWRYIMRQNRAFFSKHAVPVYLEGLKKTGIRTDRIPRISEMDECLAQLGWGAVPVVGFIPPAAFLEFQALGILPIACDMRTISHLAYTPAPDIVHEAAGHAPIIADEKYSQYLHQYARMAQKAIQSVEDIRVYEAIRYLSDIKENPDTDPKDIAVAEQRLKDVSAAVSFVSEGAKVARMAWWTVEYGLVESPGQPRIYGAGLLSSVGESQHCLSQKVRKVPLSVDCVNVSYDITEPQPQLFVAKSMEHLVQVLEDLEATLSFRRGGAYGLATAKKAGTNNTVVLDSGVECSGVVDRWIEHDGRVVFFKLSGPVHLAHGGVTLKGHSSDRHPEGFSAPLGPWDARTPSPHLLSDSDLKARGLEVGKKGRLHFPGELELEGVLTSIQRVEGKLGVLTFDGATLKRGEEVLFRPDWGPFDLAVGTAIPSVYGGPADRSVLADLAIGEATTNPARNSPFTPEEKALHGLYGDIRKFREQGGSALDRWEQLAKAWAEHFDDQWLPAVELLELATQRGFQSPWRDTLLDNLQHLSAHSAAPVPELIAKGLRDLAVVD